MKAEDKERWQQVTGTHEYHPIGDCHVCWLIAMVRELESENDGYATAFQDMYEEVKKQTDRTEKAEAEVRKLSRMVCCHYEDMQRAHDQRQVLEAEVERLREALKIWTMMRPCDLRTIARTREVTHKGEA